MEQNQNNSIYTSQEVVRANIFRIRAAGFILTSPGRRIWQRRDATRAPTQLPEWPRAQRRALGDLVQQLCLTLMTTRQISDDEEFTRDWDWYAVDQLGAIGHFTTAGFR